MCVWRGCQSGGCTLAVALQHWARVFPAFQPCVGDERAVCRLSLCCTSEGRYGHWRIVTGHPSSRRLLQTDTITFEPSPRVSILDAVADLEDGRTLVLNVSRVELQGTLEINASDVTVTGVNQESRTEIVCVPGQPAFVLRWVECQDCWCRMRGSRTSEACAHHRHCRQNRFRTSH